MLSKEINLLKLFLALYSKLNFDDFSLTFFLLFFLIWRPLLPEIAEFNIVVFSTKMDLRYFYVFSILMVYKFHFSPFLTLTALLSETEKKNTTQIKFSNLENPIFREGVFFERLFSGVVFSAGWGIFNR